MQPFKVLSHQADIKFEIFGRDLEELFQNGAAALNSILWQRPLKKIAPRGYEKIEVAGGEINTLLVNFLNAILTQSEINRKIYWRIKFLKFSETNLIAQIFGTPVERFNREVKAVTYHNVQITKNKRRLWRTELIFDV